jgi:pimeloyl-ACP methyl ester carboxylesterase
VFVVVLVGAVAVGCGGGDKPKSQRDATTKPPRSVGVLAGAGELVDIGGGRSLYLECVGAGSPTVVLEAGFGGRSHDWAEVQPQLEATTRTCAYDRAGLGSSLAIPGVHDASDEITDLQRLLEHAKIAPPYVMVGHSYGGLLARLFAHTHPDDTAGIVLVDSMGPNQIRRELASWRAQPPALRSRLPKPDAEPIIDGVDLRAGDTLAAGITTLGDTPLAVITRGRLADEEQALPTRARQVIQRLWTTLQDELAALSTNHVHVVARRSDHFVQRSIGGQPRVVIRAVRAVVRAARSHTPLPPCKRLFSGSGIRCRS